MSKSTTIECPTCAGQGVYCDDCLSTGSITVVGPVAVFVEELHSQLAAATARAEAAEAQLASVPVDALRWIDRARTSGTWSSIEGPPAYAALHEWLEQQSEVQP